MKNSLEIVFKYLAANVVSSQNILLVLNNHRLKLMKEINAACDFWIHR